MRYTPDQTRDLNRQTGHFLEAADIQSQPSLEQLREVLRFHEWRYYVLDDPLISDFEYDRIYKLLERSEQVHPEWASEDSPTRRVSSDLTESFATVDHLNPMLSLENSYDLADLEAFDLRVRKLCGLGAEEALEYFAEPKFDGGSIAVIYEHDRLVRAATRGDGARGEEITANARTIRSLPLRVAFSTLGISRVELRGEAVLSKQRFQAINLQRETDGLPLFANPRNAATGVLRAKDPAETASRNLDAFIFQVSYAEGQNGRILPDAFPTHAAWMEQLDAFGFKVAIADRKVCKTIAEVERYVGEWTGRRDAYAYDIDGVVIKVNELSMQLRCGSTAHHPRWAVAHKFQARQASSSLLDVEFQIGKIGSITPVAKIAPVQLAGVTVSSVSLHNEDFISQRDLRIGDQVLVERAGDVIPYIVKAFPELRKGLEKPIVFPSRCPACSTPLVREEDEAAWRCPNDRCEGKRLQCMIHHASKDAMDIDGLGRSLIERFYDLGWLTDLSDLYSLDYEDISELEGMGKKSAENLRKSVEKAKENPLYRLLHGLCIHHVGKKIAQRIAAQVQYLPDLADWDAERFMAIDDVGPVAAGNLVRFFANPQNLQMLRRMEALGVNMRATEADQPQVSGSGSIFEGKTILFTGTLERMGRDEAERLAEKLGARVLAAVSSKLNILVVGRDAGSKLAKAQKLGTVEILDEQAFFDRTGNE